jgi:uncharacterized protein with PIN domain
VILRKRHHNYGKSSEYWLYLEQDKYPRRHAKVDGKEVEKCVNCGCWLVKTDEKRSENIPELELITEVFECKKCGLIYEFSLKMETKNHS